MDASHSYAVLLAVLFAIAAGLVGSVALMKRMVLASDVISHLALPGLGIAYLLKSNPLIGGGATLFLGTLLVWQLQKRRDWRQTLPSVSCSPLVSESEPLLPPTRICLRRFSAPSRSSRFSAFSLELLPSY